MTRFFFALILALACGATAAYAQPNGLVIGPSSPGSGYLARALPLAAGQVPVGQGLTSDPVATTLSGDVGVAANGQTTVKSVAGHILAAGSAPSLSSCGTNPTILGSDFAGQITMGTGSPTGCVITFAAPYAAAPFCTVSWQATPLASQSYAVSASALTLTQTATSSNVVDYICVGRSGG